MNAEAQKIAIAKACGWRGCRGGLSCGVWMTPIGINPKNPKEETALPNYLNDLNAMHEAEKILSGIQKQHYRNALWTLIPDAEECITATAVRRAEAFLKALNLWEQ